MAERMDHEKMRRASELPVSGPAATDTAAASGGLELPGQEAHPMSDAQPLEAGTSEPIPGEHDRSAEAPTQPGIVGTTGYGVDLPPVDVDSTLDEDKRRQTRWEGGDTRLVTNKRRRTTNE